MTKKEYLAEIREYITNRVKGYSKKEREEFWDSIPDDLRENMIGLIKVGVFTEDEVLERCSLGWYFTEDDISDDRLKEGF